MEMRGTNKEPLMAKTWQMHHYQSGFMTPTSLLLQEQPDVVLLLEITLISWSLVIDERGGHKDLRGSDRQSVIPYVHGRIKLYCSSLSEPFIAQGRTVTLRPGARQMPPRWLKPYTSYIIIMDRSSK
jgi:hypothetical protein